MTFLGYECSRCGDHFEPAANLYTCPNDGGNLNILLDFDRIQSEWAPGAIQAVRDSSMWRYLPLLPVEDPGHEGTVLRSVGWTPLLGPAQLRHVLELPHLWVKDDGRNPTASFKDRASALVVARAQEIGAERVVTASTGNAGAALAGMAAAVGMPASVFAPKSAPAAKVAQLLIFGAQVFLVNGTYDQAFDLSLEASEAHGWYCRNTGYNPFTAEGKKTAAYEICEQLTLDVEGHNPQRKRWQSPQAVLVSVGDGNIISGLFKGFQDLERLGWIERAPRLYGIQSTGSAAIYNAYAAGDEQITAVQADTLADSISVDQPRDGWRALRAAAQSGGAYLAVTDEKILEAMQHLSRHAAIFPEPAGAAAHAGLLQALESGLVDANERVVVVNTGNGLKDIDAAMKAAGQPILIEPTMAALTQALSIG
jgi:threonine synthase